MGITLLAHASMPLKFWDEAFQTAVFLINRLPSKVIEYDTPLHRLYEEEPDYTSLHTFGCAIWPNLRPYNTRKLQFRSKRCVFIGYNNSHKGFKCLDPKYGRVYISRDVVFDESVFPFASLHSNARAKLRAELQVLPDVLRNPSISFRDALIHDQHVNSPNTSNVETSLGDVQVQESTSDENHSAHAPYRMCRQAGSSANSDDDLPARSGDSVSAPVSGSQQISPDVMATTSSPHTESGELLPSAQADPNEGRSLCPSDPLRRLISWLRQLLHRQVP